MLLSLQMFNEYLNESSKQQSIMHTKMQISNAPDAHDKSDNVMKL